MIFTGQLDIFSISGKKHLREQGKKGDLSALGKDEFYSFSLYIQNNTGRAHTWQQAYVQVDGGAPRHWTQGQVPAFGKVRLHLSRDIMKDCMTPGEHTAVWYLDGKMVHRERFFITKNMDWESLFPFPTRKEITDYQKKAKHRSPYLSGWMYTEKDDTRYTEYKIDFNAPYVPEGTYCCLGNWHMDRSSLEKSVQVCSGWVSAYAGFQKIEDGRMVSIMSFWDLECKDAAGRKRIHSAKRLFPDEVIGGGRFWGEGTGERSTAPFAWEANHWYRMHLKSINTRGTTIVEQWVCDLETGEETLLCRFDTGIADSAFQGHQAIFLENYLPKTAGEVRAMEVRNAQYLPEGTNRWRRFTHIYLGSQNGLPEYEGSYNFGVSGDRVWMITSGVGGDWFNNGKGKQKKMFRLRGLEPEAGGTQC